MAMRLQKVTDDFAENSCNAFLIRM